MTNLENILKSRTRLLQMIVEGEDQDVALLALCKDTESFDSSLRCTILIYDPGTNSLYNGAAPSLPDYYNEAIDGIGVGYGIGSCGTAAFTKKRIVVEDVFQHDFWISFLDLAKQVGFKACWSQPIFNKHDELLGTFAMYYDEVRGPTTFESELIEGQAHVASLILERTRSQHTLNKLNRRLDSLAQAHSDFICRFDEEGNFTFANSFYCEFTGVKEGNIVGKNIFDDVEKSDLQQVSEIIQSLTAESPTNISYNYNTDHAGNRRFIQWSNTAHFTPEGKLWEIQSVGRDVTRSLATEQELKKQMIQYDQAVKISGVGYWVWNEVKDFITYVSKEAADIYGMSQEAFLELNSDLKKLVSVIHPDDWDQMYLMMKDADANSIGYKADFRIVTPAGDIRYIHELAEPVYDEEGRLIQTIGTIRDVTEQKTSEAALILAREESERASRAKSEFIANMSHELRTPLNAIIGFSELLKSSKNLTISKEKIEEYAGDIYDAGAHLLNVINDILDVAKIESSKLELQETELDVPRIVDSCLSMVRIRAENAGIELIKTVNDDVPSLMGDETRIKQIISNLLSNAVKFTDAKGTIDIHISAYDGSLKVEVTDTGIGMAADDLKVALTKFGQVDASYARNHEGTGLGLTLVQLLVDLHGGDFALLSELGKGTKAIVSFPKSRMGKISLEE